MLIRSATANDQATITSIVRAAHLNPINVKWPNFVVAEDGDSGRGRIIGVGQLRPYSDGSRELASLAVVPECRGRGIGTQLTRRLLENQPGPLYLMCEPELESYYTRFGFRHVERAGMPPPMARVHHMANTLGRIAAFFGRPGMRIYAMRWDG
jgi:N-acetylglutamate synthase-like GNAT family acetyltransferase